MLVYFDYKTEINESDTGLPASERLYAYFEYDGKYYQTSFDIDDIYTKEAMEEQINDLLSDGEAFEYALRDAILESVRNNNTLYAPHYKMLKRNPLFTYDLPLHY